MTINDNSDDDITTNNECPFHASSGYSTKDGRIEYLLEHGIITESSDDDDDEAKESISESLQADLDQSKPLYFWQLYSLIGHEPILDIVENFYNRVYADDEEPWFRNAFIRIGGMNHHVQTQAAYWIDAFGGGKVYHGGNVRLNFHHYYNASEVMTAAGAKRWMHHMRGALLEYCASTNSFDDPRTVPCIVEFLKTKMKKYAKVHDWDFDESDFDFAKDMTVLPEARVTP